MRFGAFEARMSHWVLQPVVVRSRDGAIVLSLDGTGWDGGGTPPSFPAPGRVELHLRYYPDGMTTYDLVIDVEDERCWFAGAEDESFATTEVEPRLEAARQREVDKMAPDFLAAGICPDCQAQLHRGWIDRMLGRTQVTCLVCERTWQLPRDAKL